MPEGDVARKLLVKPGMADRLLNPPPGHANLLGAMPEGASVSVESSEPADLVLLFARTRADVDAHAAAALASLKPGGLLWAAFPKGASKIQTDLTRDRGWNALTQAGLRIVTLVSLDETWSAARFRGTA
jgi:hypothetical protein